MEGLAKGVEMMDDLISRAWVLAEYDRQHQGPPGGARKIMEEAPAVDAVPVVRCSECKYRYFASNRVPEEQTDVCSMLGIDVNLDFYCAYGDKDGETDG